MSGFSMSYIVLTAVALKTALANVPDDMPVMVPSINRRPRVDEVKGRVGAGWVEPDGLILRLFPATRRQS